MLVWQELISTFFRDVTCESAWSVEVLNCRVYMVDILNSFVWLSFRVINLGNLVVLVSYFLIRTTCLLNQFLVNKRRVGSDLSYVCHIVVDFLTWRSNWDRIAVVGSLSRRLRRRRCHVISCKVLAIVFLAVFSWHASTSLSSRLLIVWPNLVSIGGVNLLIVRILVDQLKVCVLKHCWFTFEHCWNLDICRPVLCVKDIIEILRLLIQFFHHLLRQFIKASLLLAEVIYSFIHGLVKVILAVIVFLWPAMIYAPAFYLTLHLANVYVLAIFNSLIASI